MYIDNEYWPLMPDKAGGDVAPVVGSVSVCFVPLGSPLSNDTFLHL